MRKYKAIILAAGEGTRLRPLTLDRPKPMVPVHGKPVIEYIIEWLCFYGINEIAINLHYRPEKIINHLGDGNAHGVQIRYSHEPFILGTAGAVARLADFWNDDPFLVVYGDVLTDLNLHDLILAHENHKKTDPQTIITMALYEVPNPSEVGIVELDDSGKICRFLEKPTPEQIFSRLANAGVFVAEPSILTWIPPNQFYDFGHHLFPQLLKCDLSMYGWIVPPGVKVLDIGTPERYALAQREWPASNTHLQP